MEIDRNGQKSMELDVSRWYEWKWMELDQNRWNNIK